MTKGKTDVLWDLGIEFDLHRSWPRSIYRRFGIHSVLADFFRLAFADFLLDIFCGSLGPVCLWTFALIFCSILLSRYPLLSVSLPCEHFL